MVQGAAEPQVPVVAEPAAPVLSSLGTLVAEAVDRLEHAPPPRRVVLEFGELRVAVSLRQDMVDVSVLGGGDAPPDWAAGLREALDARGFSLASGSSDDPPGRREAPERQEQAPPTPFRRPRSRPAETGWRL